MTPEDPFQYAPQFLLWPRLAIALTRDFSRLRLGWFGLQTALLIGVSLGVARWIAGRSGLAAALAAPALLASFPMLQNLQYGQFHFVAVAQAVLGMLAFERRRRTLGGALLATAILSKLFPAVLLAVLVGRRRWRELAWTAAAGAALTGLAFAVVGPAPFAAFVGYQLPRLSNGDAFAFGEAWPEVRDLLIAANQGVFGMVAKLDAIGLPGMSETTASWANRAFLLLLFVAAGLIAARSERASRLARVASWLALLGLGSLASAGAFADYVPLTAVWLLTLLVLHANGRPWLASSLAVCGLLQFFILGTMPVGDFFPPELMIPFSAVGAIALFALFAGTLVAVGRRQGQAVGGALRPGRSAVSGWFPLPVPVAEPARQLRRGTMRRQP